MNFPESDLPVVPKHMCAYKLVTFKFKWMGLQSMVEKFGHKQQKRIFTMFHRQFYCWLDEWVHMTMDDIRALEDETKENLEQNINKGEKQGYKLGEVKEE